MTGMIIVGLLVLAPGRRRLGLDRDEQAVKIDPTWRFKGACTAKDAELFWSRDILDQRRAKTICAGCPVKFECLQSALDEELGVPADFRDTIRGGMTHWERWALQYPEDAKHLRELQAKGRSARQERNTIAQRERRRNRTPEQIQLDRKKKKERDWARRGRLRAEARELEQAS